MTSVKYYVMFSAKKREQPKDINPTDYSQLTKYIQSYQLPTGRFDRILIQLFGFTGHGKSSFVNSCLYILGNGRFQDKAGEGVSHGGKTMERKAYELSDAITIVDNRGFAKLGAPEAWEIYAQLCKSFIQFFYNCKFFLVFSANGDDTRNSNSLGIYHLHLNLPVFNEL